ncbi:MAG TPA: cation acetate symporter [Longimicrobium sp.]|nr:cation acetate symporter [Longimicrobium sp.]HSU14466.1 cation acetate symporter [Longimicrobium sp.]
MNTALVMFIGFIAVTLVITYWASRRTKTTAEFYSAGRSITGFQNGWAVAGDYMSAASFLGIAGLIAFYGYDGFMYSVGWLVAYLTVLLLVAEPLRNTGRYTMADVLAFRFRQPAVRTVAAISTLVVSLVYMIAQMVGAGSIVSLLIPQIGFSTAIVIVGVLMLVYVIFGGMLATTWVQIIKAALLMGGTILLSILVLAKFGFSLTEFFAAVAKVTGKYCEVGTLKDGACPGGAAPVARDFTQPGLYYHGKWGALSLMSLGVALIFGTAGLPHILVRFYTVPDSKAARKSVVWAMILIGAFYIMTTFLGFGAATLVGKGNIGVMKDGALVPNQNLAAPLLAEKLGGEVFLSFVAAIAFATILAVVAGLTIASSSAFAHDIWFNVVKRGRAVVDREQVLVARIAAAGIGALSIVLAISLRTLNVAFLVGLAFAVAASANVPAILLTLYWRRFNTNGMVAGMVVGLLASVILIILSPAVMGIDAPTAATKHLIQAAPIFPLDNPAIVSVPLGFLAAILGSLLTRARADGEQLYSELNVRANTGLGAV